MVTSFWNGGNPADLVDGVRIYRVSSSGDFAGPLGRTLALHYVTWGWKVRRVKEAFEGADVVHALSPLSSVSAIKASGIPVVSTFYHRSRIRAPLDLASVPWQAVLEKHALRHSDVVITPSRASSEDLKSHFRIPTSKIRIVPLGVDMPDRVPPERKGAEEIMFVGILESRKGIDVLIQAMSRLGTEHPELRATIVGEGPARSELEMLVRKLDLRDRVRFVGFVEDAVLERLYDRSDIFAFPSLQEGFGIVLLEAMARGLPIVTTSAASIPEVVGDSAICARPGDAEAFAAALRQVVEDEGLRHGLSVRGRDHVLRSFSWELACQRTLEIYESVISEG